MKKETVNVLIAFTLGAAAGGAAALLLTPASGQETRKKIKAGFKKAKERALEELDQVKEFAEFQKERALEELDQARELAQIQKEALKEAYTEGKHAYHRTLKKRE
jgi:gas vesicle protein